MNSRREQVWVGFFVLVAAAILIGVVLTVSGAFSQDGVPHRAYFKYASGLSPSSPVRYGGILAGRIERLRVDPGDSTRIEIEFTVRPDIQVKTDSLAKITSLGALGESYLEVTTGTKDAPLAPPGSVLRSREMVPIADLSDMIGGLVPTANDALQSLNDRLVEVKVTVAGLNDLLSEPNRKNLSGSLETLNAMLSDSAPKVSASLTSVQAATDKLSPTLDNVQAASVKLAPLLEDLKATIKQADEALGQFDSLMVENRPDIRATLEHARKTLETTSQLVDLLKDTMDRNTENLDGTLVNVQAATENLKELTDTLKRHPSVLIRGEIGKDRQPGSAE
jgi:phospholipid/cholesterol/gamma-HCH transport system substrate-binding protein